MATITTQRVTYGYDPTVGGYDSVNEALDISSMLDILRPVDVPLLTLIGKSSLLNPARQVKHEWMEDEYRGQSTVTAGLNNTTDPVSVTLTTAAHAAFFRGSGGSGSPADYTVAGSVGPGDIVRIWDANGEELAIVTNTTATTIELDRSQLGTTPLAHTTAANVTIVGTLQPQGLNSVGASRTTTKANAFNYTQIFEDSFRQSDTQRVTKKWTQQDDRENELSKIVDLMGVQMERAILYGRKQKPAATVAAQQGPAGAMGGIRSFITTNVSNKAGAALTEKMLQDTLQSVWEAGGPGRLVAVVNATQKRRINTFLDAYRQADYHDDRLGTFVNRYDTDFGSLDVLLDRHMATDEVLLLDTSRIGFGPLEGRPLSMYRANTDSKEAIVYEVIGEYTLELRMEKAHARLYGLSTTAP